MLDIQSSTLSKSKLKKLRRMGLITEDTSLEQLIPLNYKKEGPGISLQAIKPITINQNKIFKAFDRGDDVMIHGFPGTGKSFVALGIALNEVINKRNFKQVVIVRSTVPTRDQGFLKGGPAEKAAIYEAPYAKICLDIVKKPNAYTLLKNKGFLQFESTSYLRGNTIDDSIIIFDECQNGTFHELDTVITRLGDNSRIFFCGDFMQGDLKYKDERQGLLDFIEVIKSMKNFSFIEMGIDDIVRGQRVKEYIIAKHQKGML